MKLSSFLTSCFIVFVLALSGAQAEELADTLVKHSPYAGFSTKTDGSQTRLVLAFKREGATLTGTAASTSGKAITLSGVSANGNVVQAHFFHPADHRKIDLNLKVEGDKLVGEMTGPATGGSRRAFRETVSLSAAR